MGLRDIFSRTIEIRNKPKKEPLFIQATPLSTPKPKMKTNHKVFAITPKQLNRIVAATIAEAATEGTEGLQGVINSAVNRTQVNPKYYGSNLWEVMSKPAQYSGFSINDPNYTEVRDYLDGKTKKLSPGRKEQIEQVQQLFNQAKSGQLTDVTGGATHYINPRKATDFSWIPKAKKTKTIGQHDFYYLKK